MAPTGRDLGGGGLRGRRGAFVVPGLSSGPATQDSSVAAPTELVGNSGRARDLGRLLPKGVGAVEQVSLAVIIKHATPEQAEEHPVGPLDGQYSVRRGGGVGYLTVDTRTAKKLDAKLGGAPRDTDLCKDRPGEPAPRTASGRSSRAAGC